MLGSLCGAGTLGLLIPPSMSMIIYAILVRESVGQLFMAGVIPGIVLAFLFMAYIAVIAVAHPEVAPKGRTYIWKDRIKGLGGISPTLALIFVVLGGIYLGWTTPSEAAAAGCAGALVLGLANRALNWRALTEAVAETVYVSGMMMFIITGAVFYATSVAYVGFSSALAEYISALHFNRYVILLLITLLYLALGCLMDGGSMLVLTIPVLYPTVIALGFDSIWFGIFVVVMIEIAQITPPVGFNLFVLSGIAKASVGSIVRASIPFFLLMLLLCVILTAFPDLALWLPRQMIAQR